MFEDPRDVLRRHHLHPRKALSQNFLVDGAVLGRIVSVARARPGLRVIEIGAGLGTLTRALRAAGSDVTAIERDRQLAAVLRTEIADVTVIETDAVTFDYRRAASPGPTTVVGNLPYHVTAPLLTTLVDAIDALETAVVMVQREVAERVSARAGSRVYGALSVMVQARCDVEVAFDVPPSAFFPPPKVHSTVMRLKASSPPRIGARDFDVVRRVVRAAFAQRRKKLRNALLALGSSTDVQAALERAGIDPGRRAETLSVEDFARLSDELQTGTAR